MATLEPQVNANEDSQTQPLSNDTGRTLTGRELQGELDDEEEGGIATVQLPDETGGPSDEERTLTVSSRTPVTPLSTISSRSRTSQISTSSSKRKYVASSFGDDIAIASTNGLLTPQKTGRPSPASPGATSPGVAYLGGMSRLRKIILDEEEEE